MAFISDGTRPVISAKISRELSKSEVGHIQAAVLEYLVPAELAKAQAWLETGDPE